MLVLRRKVGERILIGDDIVIKITYAHRGAAKIGIDAPEGTKVLREELRAHDTAPPPVVQETTAA